MLRLLARLKSSRGHRMEYVSMRKYVWMIGALAAGVNTGCPDGKNSKESSVQGPVLNCLEQMGRLDVLGCFQVGYRPGDLQYPVICAGGEAKLPDSPVKNGLRGAVEPAEFLQVLRLHLGI